MFKNQVIRQPADFFEDGIVFSISRKKKLRTGVVRRLLGIAVESLGIIQAKCYSALLSLNRGYSFHVLKKKSEHKKRGILIDN
jgi:hypothetical protein